MDIIKIKNELIAQKESKFKGNIYHYSQVNFSYNSNKIEGSKLTSDQTEAIFDTSSFIPKSNNLIKLDDLIESKNHFKLFDYMLDNVDNELSKEMIIEMNKILKRNTSDEENPRYNVGGFKIVPNIIGLVNVINTTEPKNVEKELDKLLFEYNTKTDVTLEDIIDFHYKFERIHPFGDGNGRVGRIIMFKECLKNNIMPFIIMDNEKDFYMRGLKEYENDKMFLIDTIKHEQDLYEKICYELLNFELKENQYFTANLTANNNEDTKKQVTGTAQTLPSITFDYGDTITPPSEGLYPGYKFLKKVTVKGSCQNSGEECKSVDLVLTLHAELNNSFTDHLKYAVYKATGTGLDAITCENSKSEAADDASGAIKYSYNGNCSISSQVNKYGTSKFDTLKENGQIDEAEYTGIFKDDNDETIFIEDIDGSTNDTYYILVDYVNDTENDQNSEQGKTFKITLDAALQA